MAKNDPVLRAKYYQSVREHTLAVVHRAEEAVQQLKGLGDDFSAVFEKTSKRHSALLDKVVKRVERDQKKLEDSAKAALKKLTKAKEVKAKVVKKAKPVTPKAKPPAAKKPIPPSQPEILQ
jgi:gas vesicle protein